MKENQVRCPETGKSELMGCLEARDGEPLVVLRCSRFDPPEAVTCSMRCVQCLRARIDHDPWRLPTVT
jgi:hypothetical protein